MATWHQAKNNLALALLWAPDPIRWKCVSDRVGHPAGVMFFATEQEARAYAARTGDVVIAPTTPTSRSTGAAMDTRPNLRAYHLSSDAELQFDPDTDPLYAAAYAYFADDSRHSGMSSWFFHSVHNRDGEWRQHALAYATIGERSLCVGDWAVRAAPDYLADLRREKDRCGYCGDPDSRCAADCPSRRHDQ